MTEGKTCALPISARAAKDEDESSSDAAPKKPGRHLAASQTTVEDKPEKPARKTAVKKAAVKKAVGKTVKVKPTKTLEAYKKTVAKKAPAKKAAAKKPASKTRAPAKPKAKTAE